VTDEERVVLQRRASGHTTSVRDAKRALFILLAADGVASRRISKIVGMHESNVAKWRKRFSERRRDGLLDDPRPRRPRIYGHDEPMKHDERIKMPAVATSERTPGDPVSTWTYEEMAEHLRESEGIAASASQLWRILTGMQIRLDRVRGWLNRRDDPEFWDRVRDVVGLYLNPPGEKTVVLSVDEKTAIQATERRHPDQLPGAGRPRRREFEYRRHGTVSLMAALERPRLVG